MSQFHLLYWIFRWAFVKKPGLILAMREGIASDPEVPPWVRTALEDRIDAYLKAE